MSGHLHCSGHSRSHPLACNGLVQAQAAQSDGVELFVQVDPDVGPAQLLCGQAGGRGSTERVEHHTTRPAADDLRTREYVGGRLRAMRKSTGLTLDIAARYLHLPTDMLDQMESGQFAVPPHWHSR